MKYYIVASHTAFTVVCRAKSKKEALKIARGEYWDSHGYGPEEMDNDFTVYDAAEYLKDDPLVIYED